MTPRDVCPGCGAPEGCYHERGCKVVPFGLRPCCSTRIFLDQESPHAATCPEWGAQPIPDWALPSFARDPWYDVKWSVAA
jgi:hypothetical protein